MILRYSCGIDVSAKKFDVSLITIDSSQQTKVIKSRKFENTNNGFKQFKIWYDKQLVKALHPIRFILEATGVYHENLAHFLHNDEQYISIVLANHANKFLGSLGYKSKNDKIDAKGLAIMGAQRNLKAWNPPVDFYATLRWYTRHYQTLQETKTMESNRLHAINASASKPTFVIKQLKKSISQLNKEIEATAKQITKHLDDNKEVRRKVDQISTIKGVGELTAAVLIAETFGFELFENAKQLISFSGMDVIENQSGKRQGKTKISKKGNSRIRRALFMPGFSVVTNKVPVFYNLYCRTFDKHKIRMKSYVAVQKKLLTTIFALWKGDKSFDPEYYLKCQKNAKVAPITRELHQVQAS